MTSCGPLMKRVLMSRNRVPIDTSWPFVISEKEYSREEIEKLRKKHKLTLECDGMYFIANFLPDDIRPKGVPKL